MSVQITVRNVPEEVRDELAKRAAAQRQSMQEYLRDELDRIVSFPTNAELMRRVRERKARYGSDITPEEILEARDADRK